MSDPKVDPKDRIVELYQGADGQWYWRRISLAGNLPDNVVAQHGGYETHKIGFDAAKRENEGYKIVEASNGRVLFDPEVAEPTPAGAAPPEGDEDAPEAQDAVESDQDEETPSP